MVNKVTWTNVNWLKSFSSLGFVQSGRIDTLAAPAPYVRPADTTWKTENPELEFLHMHEVS